MLDLLIPTIAQGLLWSLLALGVYITFRVLDIADLSVEGTFPLGAAVAATCITSGHSLVTAFVLAVLAGCIAGAVTGLLTTKLKIPALLSGILTMIGLYSINLRVMGRANLSLLGQTTIYSWGASAGLTEAQTTLAVGLIAALLVVAVVYWFFGTELGCSLRATGCNPSMSRAQGINTDRNKVLGLMLSNGLVALSGALLTQYQGFADINMGRGSIVIGLAAVIIGEAIFSRIFRNFALKLLSVVFGSILYYLVLQIVIWMGIDTDLLKMLSALVVAFFLAFPYWKGKYFTKAKQGGK